MALSPVLLPLPYGDLPYWTADDPRGAFAAFRRSAFHAEAKPYRTGALGMEASAFAQAYAEARSTSGTLDPAFARAFFERHFCPAKVSPAPGGNGFVTGFYEPVAEASYERGGRFRYPVYKRPPDLVERPFDAGPVLLDPAFRFARRSAEGVVPYYDRGEIERGALAGQGLEIAWLADPVDLFFIHVQGAARLTMPDGKVLRITYAAKSGHPFTGPGGILIDLGEIAREEVTMQSIRAWFRANPERIDEILWQNRSFIFFKRADVGDPSLGPIAAAKVPLTPGRSVAVDLELHTFGTPFYIDAPTLTAFGGEPFRRLMIAQDTGSAIKGPARGDLFAGSGPEAGEVAGVVRHDADFYVLVPRGLLPGAQP